MRLTVVVPALALFLTGTNLCVLGAVTGQVMACSSVPTPRKSCPSCAHHGSSQSSSRVPAPSLSPCCMTLALSSSIQLERADIGGVGFATVDDVVEIVHATAFGRRFAIDERPPTPRPALEPFGGRAPPLS